MISPSQSQAGRRFVGAFWGGRDEPPNGAFTLDVHPRRENHGFVDTPLGLVALDTEKREPACFRIVEQAHKFVAGGGSLGGWDAAVYQFIAEAR